MGGLLAACQTPGPVAPHLQQETLALDTLLGSLKQRQQGVADLKSMVRTTVENPKVRQSFKQALVLKNDEAFRIDTYNVFGQTL
nr:hypothetical protein [Nitrospinaceae bacterium]